MLSDKAIHAAIFLEDEAGAGNRGHVMTAHEMYRFHRSPVGHGGGTKDPVQRELLSVPGVKPLGKHAHADGDLKRHALMASHPARENTEVPPRRPTFSAVQGAHGKELPFESHEVGKIAAASAPADKVRQGLWRPVIEEGCQPSRCRGFLPEGLQKPIRAIVDENIFKRH